MFEWFCVQGSWFYLEILFLFFCLITAILTVFLMSKIYFLFKKKPIMGVYGGDK